MIWVGWLLRVERRSERIEGPLRKCSKDLEGLFRVIVELNGKRTKVDLRKRIKLKDSEAFFLGQNFLNIA